MKPRFSVFSAIALVALFVACGSDSTATPLASGPTSTVTFAPSSTESPAQSLPLIAHQELRVNLGGEPTSLDPQRASFAADLSVVRQVFQGLLGFAPDLSLEPVVATEIPTVRNGGISQDGLTYTFKLRKDVTWSDGEKVTAVDFVYSIKRILDPEVGARFSSLYTVIKGAQEYNGAGETDAGARQALRDAVGVEAVDEHTLRISLKSPNPTFPHKMALVQVYPVRQDVVEEAGNRWTEPNNYIGNGPYIMTEWVHQDHITLEVNPNYWGTVPELAKITFKMITDVNAELSAYRNGELDLSRVPPGTENAILSDPDLAADAMSLSKLSTIGLFINGGVAPFDNVNVRQAITTAIDREAWISKVKHGIGRAATSWLPPEMPGYVPELGSEYTFDVERAQQLLADAGFPDGEGFPTMSYPYVNLQDQPVIAQFVQAQLHDNLGIEVSLEPLDPPSYGQQVIGARQFHLTSIGWSADYPDPESFLAPLFVTGVGNNIVEYSNEDFDKLADLASKELDEEERLSLWQRAHEIVVSEAPVAFFYYEESFFLKSPKVRGLTLTGMDGAIPGDINLAEVTIVDQ